VDEAAIAQHKAETKRVDGLMAPLKKERDAVEKPYRDKLIAAERAKLPDYVQEALRTPPEKRTEGQKLNVIHVVGGGSQNELLCQLTADCCGRPVVAGPVEATVLGNALVQMIAHGELANLAEARAPNDVYSIDVPSGKVERWTESETGGLVASGFAATELVRFKSFDGREISGLLYKPPARFTGSRPVVISIHGGPEGQARPDFLGRANYLVSELGVAMVLPNVRGSAGYGKSFLKLDDWEKREDSVKDIGALLDWIKTRPDLDASRVMVTGGSYGGYMTLAAATHYDDRIRCSLDVVGISNFVTFLEHTEPYRRDLRRVEYGDERDPKMREFLTQISPLNHADRIRKPIFIVQGQNDPRVNYTESEQMVAQLKKQATPVWYLKAKDEGHGFGKKKNQDFQFYSTVAFIQEFLLK